MEEEVAEAVVDAWRQREGVKNDDVEEDVEIVISADLGGWFADGRTPRVQINGFEGVAVLDEKDLFWRSMKGVAAVVIDWLGGRLAPSILCTGGAMTVRRISTCRLGSERGGFSMFSDEDKIS